MNRQVAAEAGLNNVGAKVSGSPHLELSATPEPQEPSAQDEHCKIQSRKF